MSTYGWRYRYSSPLLEGCDTCDTLNSSYHCRFDFQMWAQYAPQTLMFFNVLFQFSPEYPACLPVLMLFS